MIPKDNQQLRALLSLPPIQPSASTALAIPEMPPREVVTGDPEIDAVLWLQKVVATGNRGLIDKALEAAKQIKTPMEDLGMRYADHLARTTGNTFGAAFASFGFGDLGDQAKRSIQRATRRHEALARFGGVDTLFTNTPAEDLCIQALHRAKRGKYRDDYDDAAAMKRFAKHPALIPAKGGRPWCRTSRLPSARQMRTASGGRRARSSARSCWRLNVRWRGHDDQETCKNGSEGDGTTHDAAGSG